MSTPFTVTHPFCKTPTFVELQNWAKEYEILISGNEQSGDFSHSKVKGDYSYENNGGLRGKFTGLHPLGKITGEYILTTGKAGAAADDFAKTRQGGF
jgi:hypothetical protein